jgi:hypothetical protein
VVPNWPVGVTNPAHPGELATGTHDGCVIVGLRQAARQFYTCEHMLVDYSDRRMRATGALRLEEGPDALDDEMLACVE